ncbi:MAG: hypothetical protein HFE63_00715 [Clostridiales bacterium]|nr:hypothetical protein [Clostridiales bacterium]
MRRYVFTRLLLKVGGGLLETTEPIGSENTTVAGDVEFSPGFDRTDYGGEKFTIFAPDWGLYSNYFFADEQNGEAMNDAIYERTVKVEEYLNVDITHIIDGYINDVPQNVRSTVMSGDDTYQLVLTHCIAGIDNMVIEDMLYDWNDFEYCDFSRSYWNQNCNENLSLNGHMFYAVSDYMLPDPNCILFNKDMIEQYSIEDPYELVRSGKWTIDKFSEMCSAVTRDLDGNGALDFNDQYGLATENDWFWNSFYYSSDIYLMSKDSSGAMKLSVNNERTITLIEKLDKLVNRSNDVYIFDFQDSDEDRLDISRGRSLFQMISFNTLYKYCDTTVDFGILPYPKLDEMQETYHTNDWSGLMCVPKTVGNTEMVSKVIELLALYSGNTTIPAYYNFVLGEKLSRDEDSKEMMSIIYDNVVYDAGINYRGFSENMINLFYAIPRCVVRDGNGSFSTWYAMYASGAEAEIEKFMEDVSKLG